MRRRTLASPGLLLLLVLAAVGCRSRARPTPSSPRGAQDAGQDAATPVVESARTFGPTLSVLAVDEQALYAADTVAPGGVWRRSPADADAAITATRLTDWPTRQLVSRGPFVYLVTEDGVARIPRGGGSPAFVASRQHDPSGLVVGDDRLCWTAAPDAARPDVTTLRCAASDADGAPDSFVTVSPPGAPHAVAMVGRDVVYTLDGGIYRASSEANGAPPRRLAAAPSGAPIGFDGDAVYVLESQTYDGILRRAPLDPAAGGPTVLIDAHGVVSCAAVADGQVYYATARRRPGDLFGHTGADGALYRIATAGGPAQLVATNFSQCNAIALGRDTVWMATWDGILRTPRVDHAAPSRL